MRTFSGFMSRWRILCSWTWARAEASWPVTQPASTSTRSRRPLRMASTSPNLAPPSRARRVSWAHSFLRRSM